MTKKTEKNPFISRLVVLTSLKIALFGKKVAKKDYVLGTRPQTPLNLATHLCAWKKSWTAVSAVFLMRSIEEMAWTPHTREACRKRDVAGG